MITTGNYAEKIKEIGVENLSPMLKEYHNDLKEATNDFTDWSDYNEDVDIKEATDLYFKEVEKLLSKDTPKNREKTKNESVKKETSKKKGVHFKVTTENYFSVTGRLDLPSQFRKWNEYVERITHKGATWEDYRKSSDVKDKVNRYFRDLEKFIQTIPAVQNLGTKEDQELFDTDTLLQFYNDSFYYEAEHTPTIDGLVHREMIEEILKERTGKDITQLIAHNSNIIRAKKDAESYKTYSLERLIETLEKEEKNVAEYGFNTESEIRVMALRKLIYSMKQSLIPKAQNHSRPKAEPVNEKFQIGQKVKLIASGEEGIITNVFVVKSGRFIPGKGSQKPKVEYSMTVKTKDSIKTVSEDEIKIIKDHSSQSKQKVSTKETSDDLKQVEMISEDVKFIKSFVGLHNKGKTYSQLRNLLARLQKAILQRLIKKDSPFAEEIKIVQDRLVKIVNATEEKGGADITIEKKLLDKLLPISGGEKIFASIGYIKRYIGMQGKKVEKDKTLAFINQIEKAIDKGRIDKGDPYLGKVKSIIKSLNSYITEKEQVVSISKTELNGLMGILASCGCSSGIGKIYDTKGKKLRSCKTKKYSDSGKGACSHNKGLSGVMTAEQVASMQFKLLAFYGIFKEIFGEPEKNFTMMNHGEPGAGKTVFLMKFVKFLSGLGSVLFVTSEEYGSATLTDKVNTYLNPIPQNLHFTSNISTVNLSDYDVVVFDSINDIGLKLEDFKRLKSENQHTAFVLVLQHTKDGQFKGGKEWEHEVQIAAEIENGIISVYKNRYGVKGEWNFFEDQDRIAA